MLSYHLTGAVSTALYSLSILGLWLQLGKIWKRKSLVSWLEKESLDQPTAIISLNYIFVAFLAYYFLFLYGFALQRFNHYLVWPRLIAVSLALAIMYEIMIDRRDRQSIRTFWGCTLATLFGLCLLVWMRDLAIQSVLISQLLLVTMTAMLVQGNVHQIMLIRRSRSTGGLSFQMQLLTLAKDLGTVAFGTAMGITTGWPLILVCGTDALLKIAILWCFYWVQFNDKKSYD